jgi:hypothetical protein
MRGQLRAAVTCKDAFVIQCADTGYALGGFEVAHIPDMLTDNVRFLTQDFNGPHDKLGLVFFAEHLRGLCVHPGNGIRSKFGEDQRFAKFLMDGIQIIREELQAFRQVTALRIPT